ncbi:MAG: GNAT family N-acetyltransferase [Alphaproteobacteria bacterium]|nr:GNAT family N-acetyltransferase [Alphaproteobacteria bacterium]
MAASEGDGITISEAITLQDIDTIRTLFLEYAESLDFSLCFQGFDDELALLPGKYNPPAGRLLLATGSKAGIVGCVGIRPIGTTDAEMKRLYVRPAFRGLALGKRLAAEAVTFARDTGYAALRLDTIADSMAAAEQLYRDMGFIETPPYYENPVVGATLYSLDLK